MAKFVTFKNANPPYEGQPILINTDHIISVYEDFTAQKRWLYGQKIIFGT